MTSKNCSKCKELKPYSFFGKDAKNKSGRRSWCKSCDNISSISRSKTKKGLSTRIYAHQIRNCRTRNHSYPNYTKEEFLNWMTTRDNFDYIYSNWVNSGYSRKLTPSADRLDDYKSYSFDNLRLVTWEENNKRSHMDMINGANNKRSKKVIQYSLDNIYINQYYSLMNASRETGISFSAIGRCCRGEQNTCKGYKWEYL